MTIILRIPESGNIIIEFNCSKYKYKYKYKHKYKYKYKYKYNRINWYAAEYLCLSEENTKMTTELLAA